jgi:predicted NAD/FAD-binding protein
MVLEILRFNREAPRLLQDEGRPGLEMPLGRYLEQHRYSREFIDWYIVPMGAAIWSTDPVRMLDFPARSFVRFFHNHGMLTVNDRPQWRTVRGGSREYVRKLTAGFADRIRLDTPVYGIRRFDDRVEVTSRGGTERFDQVFLACHSDQALQLLADPSPQEREVLGAITYQPNEAVLHTDSRLLPRKRRAWAAWNYHVPAERRSRVALTYNMNILQSLDAPEPFLVTLNHSEAIDPARIVKRIAYDHPLYTPEGVAAQARQREINGPLRTYYCGAYWRNGFHEDGVVSALSALEHFTVDLHAQRTLSRVG